MRQIAAPAEVHLPVKYQSMNHSQLSAQTGHTHLRRLFWLRNVAITAQCATLLLVYQFLSHNFPWLPMVSAISFLALLNVFSWWRLSLDYPVGNTELLLQLVADVVVLSVLLYYGGGSTNPFVSLYLLPLVIAAATLPRLHTWAMATLTLTCYSLLMVWYIPIPAPGGHSQHGTHVVQTEHLQAIGGVATEADLCLTNPESTASPIPQSAGTDAFNTHIFGMWLGFVISVMVVAYFVVEMARAVRERDAQLTRVREETLRNERIVALGMQAAGAAHELGTPLSTLAVVIGELRHDSAAIPEWQESLALLDGQVRACRTILDKLLANAQDTDNDKPQAMDQFLAETLNEWQLLRPTAHYSFKSTGTPAPQIRIDPALRAALMNLLNNAADASPQGIDIHAHWDNSRYTLEIHDHGPGLTTSAAANVGTAFFTTKEHGRGLGFFLANATLEKMGGTVRLFNRTDGGATTEVTLPLVSPA